MKIIGGHDYWDSAAAYGVDPSLVLHRDIYSAETYKLRRIQVDGNALTRWRSYLITGCVVVGEDRYPYVAFCPERFTSKWSFIYNVDELHETLSTHKFRISETFWFDGERNPAEKFFEDPFFGVDTTKILLDNRAAFMVTAYEDNSHPKATAGTIFNPSNLQQIQFFKVLDPFQMHMKVSGWVGGVLPSSRETITLSDKSKIVKAGFDLKSSFRKAKQQ